MLIRDKLCQMFSWFRQPVPCSNGSEEEALVQTCLSVMKLEMYLYFLVDFIRFHFCNSNLWFSFPLFQLVCEFKNEMITLYLKPCNPVFQGQIPVVRTMSDIAADLCSSSTSLPGSTGSDLSRSPSSHSLPSLSNSRYDCKWHQSMETNRELK